MRIQGFRKCLGPSEKRGTTLRASDHPRLKKIRSEKIAPMQPFQKLLHGQDVYAVKMIHSFACVNANHLIYMDSAGFAKRTHGASHLLSHFSAIHSAILHSFFKIDLASVSREVFQLK